MTIPTFLKSFAKNTDGSVAIWAAFSTMPDDSVSIMAEDLKSGT